MIAMEIVSTRAQTRTGRTAPADPSDCLHELVSSSETQFYGCPQIEFIGQPDLVLTHLDRFVAHADLLTGHADLFIADTKIHSSHPDLNAGDAERFIGHADLFVPHPDLAVVHAEFLENGSCLSRIASVALPRIAG